MANTSSYAENEFPAAISRDLFEGAVNSWMDRTLAPSTAYGQFAAADNAIHRSMGRQPTEREDFRMSTPGAVMASSREYGPRRSNWSWSEPGSDYNSDVDSGPNQWLTNSLTHHLISENVPHQKIRINERDYKNVSELRDHAAVSFLVQDDEGKKEAMVVNPDIARYDTSAPLYESLHDHLSRLKGLGLQVQGFGSDISNVRDGKLVDDSQQFREDQLEAFNMGDEQVNQFNTEYNRGYVIPESISPSRSGIFHASTGADVEDLKLSPKRQSGRFRMLGGD